MPDSSAHLTTRESLLPETFDPVAVDALREASRLATEAETAFGRAAHLYALRVLRVGCMLVQLREQVKEAGSRNFETIAAAALPEVAKMTRYRYVRAYEKYCDYELEITDGKRVGALEGSSEDVIDIDAVEVDTPWQDPRQAPMAEVLAAPDFEAYIGNARVRKSLFSRVRNVLGDRGITRLYREARVVPALKKEDGRRGPYAPTLRREAQRNWTLKHRLIATISEAAAGDALTREDWEDICAPLVAPLHKHGITIAFGS